MKTKRTILLIVLVALLSACAGAYNPAISLTDPPAAAIYDVQPDQVPDVWLGVGQCIRFQHVESDYTILLCHEADKYVPEVSMNGQNAVLYQEYQDCWTILEDCKFTFYALRNNFFGRVDNSQDNGWWMGITAPPGWKNILPFEGE